MNLFYRYFNILCFFSNEIYMIGITYNILNTNYFSVHQNNNLDNILISDGQSTIMLAV